MQSIEKVQWKQYYPVPAGSFLSWCSLSETGSINSLRTFRFRRVPIFFCCSCVLTSAKVWSEDFLLYKQRRKGIAREVGNCTRSNSCNNNVYCTSTQTSQQETTCYQTLLRWFGAQNPSKLNKLRFSYCLSSRYKQCGCPWSTGRIAHSGLNRRDSLHVQKQQTKQHYLLTRRVKTRSTCTYCWCSALGGSTPTVHHPVHVSRILLHQQWCPG